MSNIKSDLKLTYEFEPNEDNIIEINKRHYTERRIKDTNYVSIYQTEQQKLAEKQYQNDRWDMCGDY